MKTRDQIIYSMCLTTRHDFGLIKHPNLPLDSGMTPAEQKALWDQMAELYDKCIAPHMEFKK